MTVQAAMTISCHDMALYTILKRMKDMKYLIFGTGDYYERYKKWFPKEDIVALLDNSPLKKHTWIDGIKVVPPEEGVKLSFDVVVVLSFYIKEMKEQLTGLGIAEDRICHFYDLHRLFDGKQLKRPVIYFGGIREGQFPKRKETILLLSQDLTLGGPGIALFHAAEILLKNGYPVIFASMTDGPLRETLLEHQIPVIVDENLQIETMKESQWIKDFSLVVCNTVNFWVFLSDRDPSMHVVWWLHDSAFFYEGINRKLLQETDWRNLTVCSVGAVPERAIKSYVPGLSVKNLIYGVNDTAQMAPERKKKQDRVCFVTIGYIERRKGQDLLVKAVRLLPDEIRRKAVFYLVGQNTSLMAEELKEQIRDMPEVRITGTADRNQIKELLSHADVLVCPSREDPMPTVAAEAMMYGVPCLVSDSVGTAGYLRDREDGFLFHSENIEELSEKIRWCIEHDDKLHQTGIHARKIYETYFSMEAFEQNFMDVVKASGSWTEENEV